MGSSERREREKKELRIRILDAARDLFTREGVDRVTMRRIAEKIEYSPTAIYLHFPDKETLVRELCAVDFLSFAQRFLGVTSIQDPVERLRAAAHVYVDFAVEHPGQYRFMFMSPSVSQPAPGEVKIDREDPAQNSYRFLELLVAEAYDKKLVRPEFPDPQIVCQVLWAAVHGIAALQITKENEEWVALRPPREMVRTMVDVLVHGLLAPDAAASDARRKKKGK
jgi:AcrR family transcriptional regulator